MLVQEMSGDYHDAGHVLAASAVRMRVASAASRPAVITTIADMPVVLGMDTLSGMFAAAA